MGGFLLLLCLNLAFGVDSSSGQRFKVTQWDHSKPRTIRHPLSLLYLPSDQSFEDPDYQNDVHFWLWTQSNPYIDQTLILDNTTSVEESHFDPSQPIKILIHGFSDDGRCSFVRMVRNAYLESQNVNVISVDWEKFAGPAPWYFDAAENTKPVGYVVGDFITFLTEEFQVSWTNVHLVGFSLGAQVAGHAGYHLGGQLARITGLDPAGFMFHTVPPEEHLSPDDAQFVDVIHAAGLWIGSDESLGDVDFYPNGGQGSQPGCEGEQIGLGCSHRRAPDFFTESITSATGFEAVQCPSWEAFQDGECSENERNSMGEPADAHAMGTFFLRTNPDWTWHLLGLVVLANLPWVFSDEPSPDYQKDVHFLLWTRENPLYEQELVLDDISSIQSSHFDPSRPTKVLVHGFTDNGRVRWVKLVRDAFLQTGDANVISVDWEVFAGPAPNYFEAADNTKPVGYLVGDFFNFLVDQVGMSLSDVHVIGFSLGAQTVGHLGFHLSGQLPRITGIDPAGFLFHTVPSEDRLSREDAQLVDVIHTAGLWIGTDEIVGHVDFYPNSGMAPQPGCETEDIGLSCSHQRGPDLLAESITSQIGFDGIECESWETFETGACDQNEHNWMGYPVNATKAGAFYLRTNRQSPFAIHP
eukprot:maker-scaffold301_size216225-snap-gene-1.24 protein:Tk06236 transcript:maker-scaffold301_size216225-snap-gene-1.24-mRNA-1 annotation:"lipase"